MSAPSSCSSSVTLEQVYATVTTRCIPGWHRRPLPDVAIPLNSDRGKRLFREALLSDGLHGYFSLAETFHTQAEPSYCGPGTLSMVLNSLSIDPGSIWKGNWRYFDESTLRTCDKRKPKENPLEKVIDEGMTFEEFLYMAECNGASIIPYFASSSTLSQFQSAILAACTRRLDDLRLVCSYNRSTLQQTGTGHFSPIGAYHSKENLVLILDVARFKYPTHWIPVELLWQSMCTIDPSTGKTRGFYLISKWPTDVSIQCQTINCQSGDSIVLTDDQRLCSPEESLQPWLDEELSQKISSDPSIERVLRSILEHSTPLVIQLVTKWSFDLLQKYRLKATSISCCTKECQCRNLFESYPTFLPEKIDDVSTAEQSACRKPCARVTRSHVHAYAVPSRCALQPFIDLFTPPTNRSLYEVLKEIPLEKILSIQLENQQFYLFGGLSSILDENAMIGNIERGLMTIFLYALRTDRCLHQFDLFDSTGVTDDLKEDILYAKRCFGLVS